MKLYNVHCGFYDEEISEGIYEFHVNIPVVAEDFESAKLEVRKNSIFNKKKMHIDGIQEFGIVDGYKLELVRVNATNCSKIVNHQHRDL